MLGLYPVLVVIAVVAFLLFGLLALVARFYRQVDQGRALVINTMRAEPVVAFTGAVVYPIINRAEIMDLSVKTQVPRGEYRYTPRAQQWMTTLAS